MDHCCRYLLLCFFLVFLLQNCGLVFCGIASGADPTYGFTPVLLTDANIVLQKPYDVPLDQRYSFKDGVHRLCVYADDKPHGPNSPTQPRTEIRIAWLDYHSGIWQFEDYGFVPNGTSGAKIAQIHGAATATTTVMLVINNGNMRYYNHELVAENLYDKWFRLNIIHDVDRGMLSVFVEGENKFQVKDKGPSDLYFKCGVYASSANKSYYMESRWRDIRYIKTQKGTHVSKSGAVQAGRKESIMAYGCFLRRDISRWDWTFICGHIYNCNNSYYNKWVERRVKIKTEIHD